MSEQDKALILFSGGQDSTACLAYALDKFDHVETLGFDYGQTHKIELACRAALRAEISKLHNWGAKLGDDHTLPLPALAEIGGTALIGDGEIKMMENNLPSTFVPGRNLLFLTYGAALAYRRGLRVLVGGMCETDYSGYPDCRRDTLDSLEQAINKGMESDIRIDTPLMHIDKAETWALAHQLGGDGLVEITLEHSHTCYRGDRDKRHAWGYGCNDCPACDLRAAGYEKWKAS
ncbi:7-cyano-7-deazaguanine synthase QueC [Alphaproteobacteria bacterium]|nr:7-cyano-7-deazaguanine synthase QueC [Alphaproteobacteria bacterium]MDA8544241.1 7-cyano-7-deazaguanine synthase QueC [Alphaproteobacteria bacterium]MDA8623943.1 7-cyano-7-deazaguanine synthase QueC [Alphaproteobacteria bacterium]MDA8666853.1 7-cyano-7-deazaguanine synthase QueC [Alphaproteobacteria bacterium]MDA9590354.1 7-cyano-7-deazaguanine synthase QueC [Alphaproteobacteria bacterium]